MHAFLETLASGTASGAGQRGGEEWEGWFCQFLGEPIPALEKLWREQRVCACGRHIIDAFGDHVHACKKHTGSRKAAHETILDAIEEVCRQAGITTERRNIPSIKKRNGKMGRGDLVIKHVNLGGHRDLIFSTLQSTTNSVEIIWLTLAEMGHFATRSPARSSRAPLAPRWTATGPDMPLSNTPSYPASSPPAGASTASSCASSTSSPTAAP